MTSVKVSFIGGASMTWMPTFSQELLSCSDLAGSKVVLMDIDKEHLDVMEQYVNRMKRDMGADIEIVATTNRQEALLLLGLLNTCIPIAEVPIFEIFLLTRIL